MRALIATCDRCGATSDSREPAQSGPVLDQRVELTWGGIVYGAAAYRVEADLCKPCSAGLLRAVQAWVRGAYVRIEEKSVKVAAAPRNPAHILADLVGVPKDHPSVERYAAFCDERVTQ